jgi:hypothetical protein
LPKGALELKETWTVSGGDQGDGRADLAHSSRSADPMGQKFGGFR